MNQELFAKHSRVTDTVLVDASLPEPAGTGFKEVVVADRSFDLITLDVPAEGNAVLMFTQRLQPQLKAYVDGTLAPVFCCNALSMGVFLREDAHNVVFECAGSKAGPATQLAGLIVALGAAIVLVL